jgi:predicted PurR-regulated permease PerM
VNQRLARLLADKRARRAALLLAMWLPLVGLLIAVRAVLLPFLIALFLAYVIAPPVRWLSSREVAGRRLPRWASVLVLYFTAAAVLYIGGSVFVPQLYREAVRLTKEGTELLNRFDEDNINALSKDVERFLERYDLPVHIVTPGDDVVLAPLDPNFFPADAVRSDGKVKGEINVNLVELTQNLLRDARALFRAEAARAFDQARALVGGILAWVFTAFLVLMLTAFITADTERIVNFIFTITPVRDRSMLGDLLGRIDRGLSGVVRGQLTICAVNGILTLIGLLILKVKFAFLLATMAAVFSLVPIFGSILSTIPIVIVALSSGLTSAFLALLWIVGIHALEANLLNPKIMGDAAKIHPALVVLALIVGERYYGIVGALLAVPLMSILVTIFKAARTRAMALDEEIAKDEDKGLTREAVDEALAGPPPPPRRRLRKRHESA